jgi:hypothetical protein
MKISKIIIQILLTFAITLITAGIVTLLWSLFIEKAGAVIDWKISFVLAIVIGIALPVSRTKDK